MSFLLSFLLAVGAFAADSTYQESARFQDTVGQTAYTVVLLRAAEGHHGGRVDIYAERGGQRSLVYTHPGALSYPELDEGQPPRRFSALFKDGSRTLVYRMTNELSAESKLYILRLQDGRFKRLGVFQDGRLKDLDGDGVPEVVARKPLEGSTMIRCEEFHADAGSARETSIFRWDGRRFADVSARHPDFYEQRLAGDRQALVRLEPERLKLSGAYAGAALTLYFDEKDAGRPKEAWKHLNDLIEANVSNPAVLAWRHHKECIAQLRAEARQRLRIPADW